MTFSLLALQMARSLGFGIWSGLNLALAKTFPKLSISQDLPVTKETSVSLAIAWIHVQKLIHVQKTILFLLLSANHESLSLC